jgi:hypothetical protein
MCVWLTYKNYNYLERSRSGENIKSILYIKDAHWFFGEQRRVLVSTVFNIFVSYITGTPWSRWKDRDKWRAVVNAEMNLRVSSVSANFVTEELLVFQE